VLQSNELLCGERRKILLKCIESRSESLSQRRIANHIRFVKAARAGKANAASPHSSLVLSKYLKSVATGPHKKQSAVV
jgi:hypothetical protein